MKQVIALSFLFILFLNCSSAQRAKEGSHTGISEVISELSSELTAARTIAKENTFYPDKIYLSDAVVTLALSELTENKNNPLTIYTVPEFIAGAPNAYHSGTSSSGNFIEFRLSPKSFSQINPETKIEVAEGAIARTIADIYKNIFSSQDLLSKGNGEIVSTITLNFNIVRKNSPASGVTIIPVPVSYNGSFQKDYPATHTLKLTFRNFYDDPNKKNGKKMKYEEEDEEPLPKAKTK
jgi:hypothetical protein